MQEDPILTYHASNMVLAIHSDASYLSEPKSCSHAEGHMFMTRKDNIPFKNGTVLTILQIIQAVMSSAAEAELGALFINAKTAVLMRQMLAELGHPQPCTPMQTGNAMAHALLTNKILPKALKAMDMCLNWLRCHNAQGQFCYYWRPGTQNLADYFTKHHPTSHHKSVCPTILTPANNPEYTKLFKTTTTPITFEPQIKHRYQQNCLSRIYSKHHGSRPTPSSQSQQKVPKHSYGKGVLDLQVSTYLSDGTNPQISSGSRQSYDAP